MVWLSEWLKQIIAVILLASIIELLLPSTAYQRYVRLVVGLFILLVLLSPVLRLLQGEFDAKLEDTFKNWKVEEAGSPQVQAQLQQIQEDGLRLKQSQNRQAEHLVSGQLAQAMKEEVERKTNIPLASIEVEVESNEQKGLERIAGVKVLIATESQQNDDPGGSPKQDEVVPVEGVAIEVNLPELPTLDSADPLVSGTAAGENAAAAGQESEDAGSEANIEEPVEEAVSQDAKRRVLAVLVEGWGVHPDTVMIAAN
ncbi:stage III sporulation protein AF [Paenibacillaceae bacterium]|nr:stage III sporulation protein AF [Paenibacillaceae bacterium]